MIPAPCPDGPQHHTFHNRPRAIAKTAAALASGNLKAGMRFLRLAQPEEPVTIPVRAGHGFGDLGQAAEVLAVPGKAFFQDHDALEFAPPFAHQQRAGPQGDPIPGLGIAPIERSHALTSPSIRLVSQQSPHRFVEIAESGDLQAVTQHLHEQPPRQMSGRFAAEVVAPLSAKAFEFEAFQAGKDRRQGSVG
jgi:hypothetical protein